MYFIKTIKNYFIKKWEKNIFPILNLHYNDYNYLEPNKNIHNSSLTRIYNSIVYKSCQEEIKYNT